MDYLLGAKIAALVGLLVLTLVFGFIPARVKWFRDTDGTGWFPLPTGHPQDPRCCLGSCLSALT